MYALIDNLDGQVRPVPLLLVFLFSVFYFLLNVLFVVRVSQSFLFLE